MIVVNNSGHIKGILDIDIFKNKDNIRNRKKIIIKTIMKQRPKIVKPHMTIKNGLEIMLKNNLNILPVVENKLFIGIIQKENLLQYEVVNTNNHIQKELSGNVERVIGNYHSNNEKITKLKENKLQRDLDLLQQDEKNGRNVFYLANTHFSLFQFFILVQFFHFSFPNSIFHFFQFFHFFPAGVFLLSISMLNPKFEMYL